MFLVWHCCRRSHKPACKQQAQAHLRVNITPSWMSKAQCSWVQAPPTNRPHASQINVNAKHTGLFTVKIQVQCILYSMFCCSLCWLSITCVMTPVRLCYVAFKLCHEALSPKPCEWCCVNAYWLSKCIWTTGAHSCITALRGMAFQRQGFLLMCCCVNVFVTINVTMQVS